MPQRLPTPYRDENTVIADRLARLQGQLDWSAAARTATPWVEAVREHPAPFWAMETLLREYPLSGREGLALMRLAEALLRVPDAETAIALTADQLGRADFAGHAGESPLGRLSSVALDLSSRMLAGDGGLVSRLGSRTVVAAALRAVQLLGRQFVLGQDIADALAQAREVRRGQQRTGGGQLRFSFDMLGEGARTARDAERYFAHYRDAIVAIVAAAGTDPALPVEQHDGISIKLSALHPRYEFAQQARVMHELVPRVWALCELAATAGLNLTIDAEEVDRLELSLEVFEALAASVAREHPHWQGFGLALQAYQTRAVELVEHVAALARRLKLRLMCRLVKGAYWDAEIKRTQEMGLPHYPVFTHKQHTDVSYLACARALLDAKDAIYPQFATHNAGTVAAIVHMARGRGAAFELQRLHGMGQALYREVLQDPSLACRVYAPVGKHRDLLAYLVRRLLENGANSSFVHQLADPQVDVAALLASPLHALPAPALPLPRDLYGPARPNSDGIDLAVEAMREPLLAALRSTPVAVMPMADPAAVSSAVARAQAAFQPWATTPVQERATALRRAADAMQADLPHLCALLVQEAFKCWPDAVAEVREAIDFLRYYAIEAESALRPQSLPGPTGEHNELRLEGRGPWVCISPWNFPLAIFTGQVAAALATGNTVLAKPAEQTPAIAAAAVQLLHAAGVPREALQLLHGPGETVGAALVAAPGIAGVVFTGSTQVARTIARALAAKDGPIVPLIAETGGLNAMVVDSTALPEQVADAVVQSAFRSAGQRCSALRLLCLHEAIADPVLEMVAGAARELVVGDPALLATDVGPVIDAQAHANLERHVERLRATAKPIPIVPASLPAVPARVGTAPAQAEAGTQSFRLTQDRRKADALDPRLRGDDEGGCGDDGSMHFIPPHIFELARISDLREEVFGPVLHVVRWSGDPLSVIDQVNALGWGLTLGIQTRIDNRAQAMAARARVGNVYVNRNMIGAVVGVQPFGGEGLSGTGPKAGGPHYLLRFCAERTVTVNTAAAGGNVALLAG